MTANQIGAHMMIPTVEAETTIMTITTITMVGINTMKSGLGPTASSFYAFSYSGLQP